MVMTKGMRLEVEVIGLRGKKTGIKISYLFKIHLHLVILYTSSAAKFKNIVWLTYISTVAGIGFDIVVGVAVVREDAVISKLCC